MTCKTFFATLGKKVEYCRKKTRMKSPLKHLSGTLSKAIGALTSLAFFVWGYQMLNYLNYNLWWSVNYQHSV